MRSETRIPPRNIHENTAHAPIDASSAYTGVMAESSNQDSTETWPQTRCAKCQTVFEVPVELLESSDTRVRCGECLSIFDAREGVERQKEFSLQSTSGSKTTGSDAAHDIATHQVEGFEEFSNLDVTYSDFDLFSNEAELPEVPYFEEPKERAEFNFDSVEIDHDQTFSDTLFVNDVTINADLAADSESEVTDKLPEEETVAEKIASKAQVEFTESQPEGPSEPLIFQYHDPDDTGDINHAEPIIIDAPDAALTPSKGPVRKQHYGLKLGLATLLLAALLASLYLYRERDRLYNDMRVRPVYELFCSITGCNVPLPFAPEQMGLMRRSIYPHPDVENALVINVVIKNKASFAQRYPVLVIRLEENNGKPLASRDFPPQEYLEPRIWRESTTIAAGAAISITLEVKDPGENAGSFTLNFR